MDTIHTYLTLIRSIELLDGIQHVLGRLATSHGSSVDDFAFNGARVSCDEDKNGAAVMGVIDVNRTTCFVRSTKKSPAELESQASEGKIRIARDGAGSNRDESCFMGGTGDEYRFTIEKYSTVASR